MGCLIIIYIALLNFKFALFQFSALPYFSLHPLKDFTSAAKGEGDYVFTPFLSVCLFINCWNPSDFGNYVGRLCVSFCMSVCLSVCLFVCVFVYPVAATPFQRS